MLERGDIAALISPRPPSSFTKGTEKVKRLFENYRDEEVEYYRKNRFFPIMHIIVIRRDVTDTHPWVAQSLYKAFCLAKEICYRHLDEASALHYSLPFLMSEVEATQRMVGNDFWPYGVEKNQKEIETFIRYALEQGVIEKTMSADDLFAENTLSTYKV